MAKTEMTTLFQCPLVLASWSGSGVALGGYIVDVPGPCVEGGDDGLHLV